MPALRPGHRKRTLRKGSPMSEIWFRDDDRGFAERANNQNPFPVRVRANHTPGAQSTEVASGTGAVQGLPAGADLRLMGISVAESAGTPATAEVNLYHGTSATAPALMLFNLAANESVREWFGSDGICCPGGVFVNRVSGSSWLVLYWKLGLG